jgi:hypothetical protein
LGAGGLAPSPNPQSPIPNPQSPIPIDLIKVTKSLINYNYLIYIQNKLLKIILFNKK